MPMSVSSSFVAEFFDGFPAFVSKFLLIEPLFAIEGQSDSPCAPVRLHDQLVSHTLGTQFDRVPLLPPLSPPNLFPSSERISQ